jgi:hypothetical protein
MKFSLNHIVLAQEHLLVLVLGTEHLLDKLKLGVVVFDLGVGALLQLLQPLQHLKVVRLLALLCRHQLLNQSLHLVLLVVNNFIDVIILGEVLLLMIKSIAQGGL